MSASRSVSSDPMFISNAEHATMFTVFARTDPEAPKARGISCIFVHKGSPGFQVSRHLKKMGYKGIRTSELVFDDARVPLENLLAEENKGFPMIMSALEGGRIGVRKYVDLHFAQPSFSTWPPNSNRMAERTLLA